MRGGTCKDEHNASHKDGELAGPKSLAKGSAADTEGPGDMWSTVGGGGIETEGTAGISTGAAVAVRLVSSLSLLWFL